LKFWGAARVEAQKADARRRALTDIFRYCVVEVAGELEGLLVRE